MGQASTNFEQLIVWQKAHEFVLKIYKSTQRFPKEELYGLVSQIRRAAVSIPANIAEGYRRLSKPDKARFFNISQGSLEECRYYLILSRDLDYLNGPELFSLTDEIGWLLDSYHKKIVSSRG